MKAIKAITLSLGDLNKIVVSKYQFSLIVNNIYLKKTYKGEVVNLQKENADIADVNRYLKTLLEEGILSPYKNLSGIYTLLGRIIEDIEDIACTVDPFCYLSHLSAMSYHSLTDRIPTKLFISSPSSKEWHEFAKKQMEKDLETDYIRFNKSGLPKLIRTKIHKINKTDVHCFNSKHLGAFKRVKGRALKVSTIGKTFLDMLRNPELCGGINHVLDIYEEFGEKYLRLITDEIDNNGAPIDKVRAGYIFNELLDISNNEVIENWSSYAQRGGSRKLDPRTEYIPEWSDKWKISLNVSR